MKIVKLDAIDSTNEFLKKLAKDPSIDNWTVIQAETQLSGRGQLQNKWHSEPGKNLTFSVLYKNSNLSASKALFLNCAVSLAVYKVLAPYVDVGLSVKWPNDILAASKKLCGILIENTLVKNQISRSVVGIGLNVNQEKFDAGLKSATSLIRFSGKALDRDALLNELLASLKQHLELVENQQFELIKTNYEKRLYQRGLQANYRDEQGLSFQGIIRGIDEVGRLVMQLEDGTVKTFQVKEVKFL